MSNDSPKVLAKRSAAHSAYPQWANRGDLDDILFQAQDVAQQALLEIAPAFGIGEHAGARLPKDVLDSEKEEGAPAPSRNHTGGEHNKTAKPSAGRHGNIMLTHLFSSGMRGYQGWQWFVTLSRVPHSDKVTVSELGLLPSADAIIAPEWIPWSKRTA